MDTKNRIIGFDYLRAFAAFSVVWIHGCYANPYLEKLSIINKYAVPCFILMSIFLLSAKYSKEYPFKIFIRGLLKRIFCPFIFWTVIYLLLKYIKTSYTHEKFETDFETIFTGGVAVQTWFLPALILWQLLAFVMMKFYKNYYLDLILMILSFAGGEYLIGRINPTLFEGGLIGGTVYVFAAMLFWKLRTNLLRIKPTIYFAIMSVFFIFFAFYQNSILNVIWSLSVFLFFLPLPLKSNKYIEIVSSNSFGIYLIHFVFIQIGIVIALFFHLDIATISFGLFNIFIAFLASLIVSLLFKRNFILKYFV